ncbi:MAG: methyltransferase domain-containing protein [Xanthomonadales bacterium]|nr:methyltransferase domain-containing protein [Xanthomonadales bacterium]NIN58423.1 methyltransferase domain-containing protein [Xanthomonadales bacterium]NIN73760.1 methyltransferase domain-containing protein [Xanthomonadales bacterium]NIO13730.1 methyltransferase domain-containing protein [Xanthomonadales bacterium]NIP10816.1 methyltransferase domain-containing protein [Xanthomonadales bacterium]
MSERFPNTYADERRAASYASLECPGTYYLAFRDLPDILARHAPGPRAIDFGCGAGRSTRFLRALGFEVIGVDISEQMLALAQARDPNGEYRLMEAGDFSPFAAGSFDLATAIFPFDNIPTFEAKVRNLEGLGRLLRPAGCIVNLVSSPAIYRHEWVSFSTRDFPDNHAAQSGDIVRVVMLDVEDSRPVEDVLWTHESYLDVYRAAGLRAVATYRPLGREDEQRGWATELTVAPWVIYVLQRA